MIFQKRKYPSIKALAAAFESGELLRTEWKLLMDNDGSYLVYVGPVPDGLDPEGADDFRENKTAQAAEWFHGSGYGDIVDACNAAGIPTEWC